MVTTKWDTKMSSNSFWRKALNFYLAAPKVVYDKIFFFFLKTIFETERQMILGFSYTDMDLK